MTIEEKINIESDIANKCHNYEFQKVRKDWVKEKFTTKYKL